MIISKDNAIYIQKQDLEFLKYYYNMLPTYISQKIFENPDINLDDYSKYDLFKFDDSKDIEFFNSIDCLIDYTSIKNFSIGQLVELGKNYAKQLEEITKRLYATNNSNQEYSSILLQYKSLNYKLSSLRDIIDFLNGAINMPLPKKNNHKAKISKLIQKHFQKSKS